MVKFIGILKLISDVQCYWLVAFYRYPIENV